MRMPIARGTKIGSYEVLSPLGEGGMGVVFRARDTRLQRDVALKLLPDHFAGDPERLARFQREAQVLASLNHPNIAQVHGLEESPGNRCIVMELVDGETIQERLKRGPIPIDEALQIAIQISEALEAAHAKGIVHRDLKPANIKITPGRTVKVLDFGLAKANQDSHDVSLSNSPTMIAASVTGTILGTAAYMSPEQAKGHETDQTTDVWAFGCVLYEMVAGTAVFQGDTSSEIIACVLKSEPDWTRLPSETPENVRRLLRRCLRKDRKHRLQNIGDARIEIEDAASDASPQTHITQRGLRGRERFVWAIGLALVGLIAVISGISSRFGGAQPESDRPLIRLNVDLGAEAVQGSMVTVAISPDGNRIVFPWRDVDGTQALATRRLNESKVTRVAGTEGGSTPFFSSDGRWIGFVSRGSLNKVLVEGGAPITIAKVQNSRGATWTPDNFIITALTNRASLSLIPADGGRPEPLLPLDPDELSQRWPQVLPNGRAVLFTGGSPTLNTYENATIDVVTLATKARKTLWRGGYFGRYVPSRGDRGHLLYLHEGVLFGVAFDPERLELEGTPSAIVDSVASDPPSGGGQFDVSASGTLVYLEGLGNRWWSMVALDGTGKSEPILPKPGMYYSPRFSPDGRRLAFAIEAGNGSDVFVYDFANQSTTRLSFSQLGNIEPVWTPDGRHIVYRSVRSPGLWWVGADGGGEPQRLLSASVSNIQATSFSPDGTRLLYHQNSSNSGGSDVYVLPLDLNDPDHPKAGMPQRPISTPADENSAAFSPDGQWIAYSSNESGQVEIYVRRATEPGGKWQVSVGGGNLALWLRNSKQILYVAPGDRIMVAEYEVSGASFVTRKPRQWSPTPILSPGFFQYDVAPDGKRVAAFLSAESPAENRENVHVTFLLNFFDELKRRAPARR
jgi:serine/threonine-protein kinase